MRLIPLPYSLLQLASMPPEIAREACARYGLPEELLEKLHLTAFGEDAVSVDEVLEVSEALGNDTALKAFHTG